MKREYGCTHTNGILPHLGLFGKEGLQENCASGTILSSSITKVSRQEDRVISSTPIGPFINLTTSAKKKGYTRTHPCFLCVRRSRRIELKLASWVCGLLGGACEQGSMPPGGARHNQGLRRYLMQKGSPDATK